MRRVFAILLIGLALTAPCLIARVSLAASSSVTQLTPGVTTKTIWDSASVACYRLPQGVDHLGYIHVELHFEPVSADMDLYLLDSQGREVGGLGGEQGSLALLPGQETVDYCVDRIMDTTVVRGSDGVDMVGDTYYVLAVAFNETAKASLRGYYPQIDLSSSWDVSDSNNYYLRRFAFPKTPGATFTLHGPDYGRPYLVRPTSEGSGSCSLEWPADLVARSVTYDPSSAPQPARMGQYLYAGAAWNVVFEDEGAWAPPAQAGWWGLFDSFKVGVGNPASPYQNLHYVPNLYAVASDPAIGAAAPPKTGVTMRGFKATISYPENLRIGHVAKSGSDRVVSGTLALNGAYVSGGTVVLQQQVDSRWIAIRSAKTDSSGRWSIRVRSRQTLTVRGKAQGDPSTGLAIEYSAPRTISF